MTSRKSLQPVIWAFLSLALVTGTPAQAVTNESDALVPKILSDWQTRRERAPLIRFRLSGTQTWNKGAFAPDPEASEIEDKRENPEQDITVPFTRNVTLDFARNRCRVDRDDGDYHNLKRMTYRIRVAEVGDNGVSSCHILENSNPGFGSNRARRHEDFLISRGDPQYIPAHSFSRGYEPIFYACGVVATMDARVRTVAFAPTNDPSSLKYVGRETVAARPCVILRVTYDKRYTQISDYWVDLERDSAVVRVMLKLGNDETVRDISYRQTTDGWLPERWTEVYRKRGKAAQSESVKVDEIAVLQSSDDKLFTLAPAPGMYVNETTYYSYDPLTEPPKFDRSYYYLNKDGSRTKLSEALYPLENPNGAKTR